MPSQSTIKTVSWYSNDSPGVLLSNQNINLTAPMNGGDYDDYDQQGWSISGIGAYTEVSPKPPPVDPIPGTLVYPDPPWWWTLATNPPLKKRFGYNIPYFS